jgi:hypothetical protein
MRRSIVLNLPLQLVFPACMGWLSTEDLLVLTSLDQLLLILETLFTFNNTSYLNEEVNCTKPSPSDGVPFHLVFSKCTSLFCYGRKLLTYNVDEINTCGQCHKTFFGTIYAAIGILTYVLTQWPTFLNFFQP